MKRNVLLAALLLTSANAIAQISDEQAFELAREFASRIPGAPIVERPTQVGRHQTSGLIDVFLDGNAWVTLTSEGKFLGYADMRRKPAESGAGQFATEEEAWRAAEALVAKFDAPEGLVRERIKGGNDPVPVVHCIFETRPNGYPSHHGASVSFQRSDGAVLNLIVFPGGWTYEPPNIQISESQAKIIASERMGGAPEDWRGSLVYWAGSSPRHPQAIRQLAEQKIQRLVYSFVRRGDRAGIFIDSVTGDVINQLTGPAEHRQSQVEQQPNKGVTAPRETAAETADNSRSFIPLAIAVLGLAAIAFVSIRTWRK
jgi:hypothetical protein